MARDIAGRIPDPTARGVVAIARGMADYQTGRWRAALAGFDEAARTLRQNSDRVVFEISCPRRIAVSALFRLGELDEMCRRVPEYLREAEQSGDLYGASAMRVGMGNAVWLIGDDPDTARAECERGGACLSRMLEFSRDHYYQLLAQVHIDLYVGDGEEAYQRLADSWPKLEKSMLLRIEVERVYALFLRGRAALATAMLTPAGSARRRSLLAEIGRIRRRLAREELPGALAAADMLAAGVARLHDDIGRAVQLLTQAESGFRAAEMALAAAASRYRRGELIGGAAGTRLLGEGESWMHSEKVKNAAAMARLVAP